MTIKREKIDKLKHVSIFYGTARMNLNNFKLLQSTYKNTSGRVMPINLSLANIDGLVFASMGQYQKKEVIPYLITDPSKTNDLPILVAVHNIKLSMPVQIAGYHAGNPSQKYTGSPTFKELTDSQAKTLIKDAIKANPNMTEPLEQLLKKYIALIDDFAAAEENKDIGYIPLFDDVCVALKQCSKKHMRFCRDVRLDVVESNAKNRP